LFPHCELWFFFEILIGRSSLIYHERKWSLLAIYAFKQESFWHILWLHLGYHVLFILSNILFVHISLWIVHLETHIHESVNLLSWYPRSLPIHLFFGVLVRTWFMSVCFTLIDSSCTYISWMLLESSLSLLNDIEGVRIPCLCILFSNKNIIIYAQTFGGFLISFIALFLLCHDILYCPIGSLDPFIACFFRWSFLFLLFICSLWFAIWFEFLRIFILG
jgi:hypothetical protein